MTDTIESPEEARAIAIRHVARIRNSGGIEADRQLRAAKFSPAGFVGRPRSDMIQWLQEHA